MDYIGCRNWIIDTINPKTKPWKTNKEFTKEYRKFCLENRDYINDIVKVKGHSGDQWNEYADKLVKDVLGIKK